MSRETVAGLGAMLMMAAWVTGAGVWIYTTYSLYVSGDTGLALVALVFPPADLILAFVVSPTVGLIGVLSIVALLISGAMTAGNGPIR